MSSDNFKSDVRKGLSNPSRQLSSKYFYDEKGSELFEKIMRMPEYYLTRCEAEILRTQSDQITGKMNTVPSTVVEFGSGDGTKTVYLLKTLRKINPESTYVPVDISAQSIESLSKNIHAEIPDQQIKPVLKDYFSFNESFSGSTLFLFLGSNIGNYPEAEMTGLLNHFYRNMKSGDYVLIGFDLQKDREMILKAYDDPSGITKAFNLNLLERINRELGADFKLNQFGFTVTYNESNGELKSFLQSLKKQTVHIDALNMKIDFEADERIWTELSKKYTLSEINKIAVQYQFKPIHHFTDDNTHFAVSLWQK